MTPEQLPQLLRVLYPFEPHLHPTAEGNLHYVDEGQGDAIVFLHGNPTWSFFYREVILALRSRYRCLALDHLGCGLSDKPQQAHYRLAGHIERALSWLQSLQLKRFHLVVHDWGGAIGMGVAKAIPDQVHSLTILNTAAFPFPSIPPRIAACRIPLLGKLAVRGANLFAVKATELTTVQPLSPAAKDGFLFPYGSWANRVAIHAFVKDIPMSKRHPSWQCLYEIGDSISRWRKHPVQIIWGMQDWCFHTGILDEWQRRLPEAVVHRIDDAGHYLIEDAPETVIGLLSEFLASV